MHEFIQAFLKFNSIAVDTYVTADEAISLFEKFLGMHFQAAVTNIANSKGQDLKLIYKVNQLNSWHSRTIIKAWYARKEAS